jgi:hypothetical protein
MEHVLQREVQTNLSKFGISDRNVWSNTTMLTMKLSQQSLSIQMDDI